MPQPFCIPYPTHVHPSAYGPPTSNTNFCELDYQFSRYIAEFINTLSNVTYLIYAYHGLRILHHRNRLTFQAALPHVGLICVGLGSVAFHSTMLKLPQLADEIGMAIPTGAVVSRLVSFQIADPGQRRLVYAASVAVITTVYVVHCIVYSNWIHYPAFGVMVAYVGRRSRMLIRNIENEAVRRKLRAQAEVARVLSLGSFGLWLIDRLCCQSLMAARGWLGLPWGWLLELHGWWHVGTAMGAFSFIQVAQYLTEDGGRGDPGKRLSPFGVWSWKPVDEMVEKGGREKLNGDAVGKSKKQR